MRAPEAGRRIVVPQGLFEIRNRRSSVLRQTPQRHGRVEANSRVLIGRDPLQRAYDRVDLAAQIVSSAQIQRRFEALDSGLTTSACLASLSLGRLSGENGHELRDRRGRFLSAEATQRARGFCVDLPIRIRLRLSEGRNGNSCRRSDAPKRIAGVAPNAWVVVLKKRHEDRDRLLALGTRFGLRPDVAQRPGCGAAHVRQVVSQGANEIADCSSYLGHIRPHPTAEDSRGETTDRIVGVSQQLAYWRHGRETDVAQRISCSVTHPRTFISETPDHVTDSHCAHLSYGPRRGAPAGLVIVLERFDQDVEGFLGVRSQGSQRVYHIQSNAEALIFRGLDEGRHGGRCRLAKPSKA